MNFYREGKTVSLTSGVEYDIPDKQHKGVLLTQNSNATVYTLKFYRPDGETPSGVTYGVAALSSGLANPFIIPATVKTITADQNSQIVLLF